MNQPSSEDQRKHRAAYAAIVPFLLAEVVIVVLIFTESEMNRAFFGILFAANLGLALIFALVAAGTHRRR